MSETGYLNGFIYHMVHVSNLPSIFQQGALLSKDLVTHKGITPHSIALESVQDRRDRIFIWDSCEQRYRRLHSYVPLYFSQRSPMLHHQHKYDTQDQIVIIVVSRLILKRSGVVFTDGNAVNQQLSNGKEKVFIAPANVLGESCLRRYVPVGGPYGTNSNRSDFYSNVGFLSRLNWDVIDQNVYIEDFEESKRIRSSEVLIPDILPLNIVHEIAVRSQKMEQNVKAIVSRYSTQLLEVVRKPQLFISG